MVNDVSRFRLPSFFMVFLPPKTFFALTVACGLSEIFLLNFLLYAYSAIYSGSFIFSAVMISSIELVPFR